MTSAIHHRTTATLFAVLCALTSSRAWAQEQPTANPQQASAQDVLTANDTADDGFRWYRPTAQDAQLPIPQAPVFTPPPPWVEPHSASGIGVEIGGLHHFAGNYGAGRLLGRTSSFFAARVDIGFGGPAMGISVGLVEPADFFMLGLDLHFVRPITLWRSSSWMDVELLLPAIRGRMLVSFDATDTLMGQGSLMLGGVRLFACNRLQIDWRLEGPSFWWVTSAIAVRNPDGTLSRVRSVDRLTGWSLSWGSSVSASVLF